MADNTVTLILDGSVPLDAFAKGVNTFCELVYAISASVAQDPVNWVLSDLQFSSAVATAKVEGSEDDTGLIIAAYEDVGNSLQARTPIRYGAKVSKAAKKLYNIGVERVRLETASREAIVSTLPNGSEFLAVAEDVPVRSLELVRSKKPSFGAIRGRIQTLTSRGGLRFTLFDLHQDRAVSCYFEEGKQDIVRDLWGRLATVEGMITRDPITGRPLSIRGVAEIVPLVEPTGRRDFEEARGASLSLLGMSAEEAIHRVRDAK